MKKSSSRVNTSRANQDVSRTTIGQQQLLTLAKLNISKWFFYFAAAAVCFLISESFWIWVLSKTRYAGELDLYLSAFFSFDHTPKAWKIVNDGITLWWPNLAGGTSSAQPKLVAEQVKSILWSSSITPFAFWFSVLFSLGPAWLGLDALVTYFYKRGKTEDSLVRGGQLIDVEEYERQIVRGGKSALRFGGLPYPRNAEFLGTLIVGEAGSGKSNEYKPALEQVFKIGAKTIVFDPTGDDTARYFRPGKDILLAPANQLIVMETGELIEPIGWSILREIKAATDGRLIANSIIPANKKQQTDFFYTGAQAVLADTLVALRTRGETRTYEIYDIFANASRRDELSDLLSESLGGR